MVRFVKVILRQSVIFSKVRFMTGVLADVNKQSLVQFQHSLSRHTLRPETLRPENPKPLRP
eukprot:4620283-Amphidinium_carterae.2